MNIVSEINKIEGEDKYVLQNKHIYEYSGQELLNKLSDLKYDKQITEDRLTCIVNEINSIEQVLK